MTIPKFNTWSGGVDDVTGLPILPRRPSVDDVGRADLVNETGSVPDERTMPTADGHNQVSWQLASLARMVPALRVTISYISGVPTLVHLAAADDNITLVSGHITITDVGTGIVDISWPANTIPPVLTYPFGATLHDASGMIRSMPGSNKITVWTYNAAGTAADRDFTVSIG